MVKRVYVDTSVIGGYFDDEFSRSTIPFFDRVIAGELKIIISDLLEAELIRAPEFVRSLLNRIDEKQILPRKLLNWLTGTSS